MVSVILKHITSTIFSCGRIASKKYPVYINERHSTTKQLIRRKFLLQNGTFECRKLKQDDSLNQKMFGAIGEARGNRFHVG